jgi:hypothetical protein
MVTCNMYSSIVSMLLLTVAHASLMGGVVFAKGEDGDLVRRITKALPPGWSVELTGVDGNCVVHITTGPMETQPKSRPGNSVVGLPRNQVVVSVIVLPRYTTEMLDRIKRHNRTLREKTANEPDLSGDEYRGIISDRIDEPTFYDSFCGFSIVYPLQVPSRVEDLRKLMDVLRSFTSDWKSYDTKSPDVAAELRRMFTR